MSWIVKVGKQGKKIVKKLITPAEKHYVGYTRRIERVQTTRRICAMTFDDGPMGLPASPDRFDGRTLTDVLLDTLAQYGARGSFDVIGDTSANYPDEAGKLGSAAWGGVRFDHYPDIHCDEQGGAEHNDRLIRRMLAEGHQITNHGYRHIIFQKDGYNMAKRTPVAFALGEQLALLQEYGYQVVPVGELLAESPFADVGRDEPLFDRLTALAEQRAIVFADNRLRLDDPMTVGELAMLLAPKAEVITRRVAQLRQTGRAGAYDGAMAWCRENGLISEAAHPADHVTALPEAWFAPTDGFTRRDVYAAFRMERL